MDAALIAVKWQLALAFFQDVVVFSPSVAEHFDLAKDVVALLRDVGVTQKLKNCNFFLETIEYFGHVIRARR